MSNPQQQLNHALACHQAGRLDEAETAYRGLLQELPDNPQVMHLLGVLLHQAGKSEDGIEMISSAISKAPGQAQFYGNLCLILADLNSLSRAATIGRLAVLADPGLADGYNNLGLALNRANFNEAAIGSFTKAITINPQNASAHNNLGCGLQDLERMDEAIPYHIAATKLDPTFADAFHNLANAYGRQTRTEDARAAQRKVIELRPNSASHLKNALLLQSIPMNRAEINEDRARLTDLLRDPPTTSPDMIDPSLEVGSTGFGLSYHGLDNKNLQIGIAEYYQSHCPGLTVTAKHAMEPKRRGEKIRLGIVSAFLGAHTIGKLNHGLIQFIDQEKFEVVLFTRTGKADDAFEKLSAFAEKTVILPNTLTAAQSVIAEQSLDILFYPDIGMDPLTYFLPFGRLAPVQCTTWGHPETTGIQNMDYFISSRRLETGHAEERYTEKLHLLDRLPTCYFRPNIEPKPLARQHFGLPEDATLYCCPQTLFKLHPDFDGILGTLLRETPNSKLILIASDYPQMNRRLQDRFAQAFPDQADDVIFLPKLSQREFIDLTRIADVVLESPHFGGGNSSYETFASGTPIVVFPDKFLRTRVTTGLYDLMAIDGCIAESAEQYVDLALKLAMERDFYHQLSDEIASKSDALFLDKTAVREIETFFETAFSKALQNT